MKSKILFSTTKNYNPGDELILKGIENLFSDCRLSYEKFIYDRNPRNFNIFRSGGKKHLKQLNTENINYVIFAGTPEWSSEIPSLSDLFRKLQEPRFYPRLLGLRLTDRINDPLLKFIIYNQIQCSFLGVGSSKMPTTTAKISRILKNQTDLLIVRDLQTYDVFSQFSAVYLTCPAFFSVRKASPRKELRKVAFTLQGLISNRIRLKVKNFSHSLEQYKQVRELMGNVDVICHTRKDAEYLHKYIEGTNIRIAETANSLMNVYSEYDSIFSTRLHGCILANSFGTPCFPLHSSNRMGALDRLLESKIAYDAVNWIRKLDVEKESHRLLKFKESEKQRYLSLLGKMRIAK